MRWLVFFLVVLNFMVLAWFGFQQTQQAQQHVAVEQEQFNFSKVPSLVTLQEMPQEEIERRDVRLRESQPVEVEALGVESSCALIGPYPEHVSAKQAKNRISTASKPADVVEWMRPLPPIYWVYMLPKSSREEALAALKELQAEKIDSFLISDGEYVNGISLGLFSKEDSALKIMEARKAKGYNVTMKLREREEKTYWVAFRQSVPEEFVDSSVAKLSDEFEGVKKQEKSCPDVALLKVIE